MPNGKLPPIYATIPKWAIPRWWLVAYKIPPPVAKELGDLVEIPIDARFEKVVSGYISAVLAEGKMPPADIAPTILNLSQDLVNGRDMVIRTGDYIAIQNHLRTMK
jgi:hypothetical protein